MRDDFASVAAIKFEVFIRCHHQRAGFQFRHPHEAGVRQVHRLIAIFPHQRLHEDEVDLQVEVQSDHARSHELQRRKRVVAVLLQPRTNLRQHRLATHESLARGELPPRPAMVFVRAPKISHPWSGVQQHGFSHARTFPGNPRSRWRLSRRL